MLSITGFILVGGQSTRMGTDKSQLTIDEQTFVERIADELTEVTSDIRVVGDNVKPQPFPAVADIHRGWGAFGGLHAALSACTEEWALVVGCDFPFVTGELFNRLATFREDFDAVAPVQEDNIPQPLCTLYRTRPCLERAEALIKSGERKPIALLQSVRTRWVLFDEIASLAQSAHFFDNINTPEDYARLVKKGARRKETANPPLRSNTS